MQIAANAHVGLQADFQRGGVAPPGPTAGAVLVEYGWVAMALGGPVWFQLSRTVSRIGSLRLSPQGGLPFGATILLPLLASELPGCGMRAKIAHLNERLYLRGVFYNHPAHRCPMGQRSPHQN
jgi:hypothetical protein